MIDLRIPVSGSFDTEIPFVIQLRAKIDSPGDRLARFARNGKEVLVSSENGSFSFFLNQNDNLDGDICIVFPQKKILLRLIRENSNSNTILLTEQCDQACIMCSQPPKNKIYDHYELYRQAFSMAPKGIVIGISGGEPTLEKHKLLPFLIDVLEQRKDLKFHILTNCQHFTSADIPILRKLSNSVLWGVPLYSHRADKHDEIVGKINAYDNLLKGLNILFKANASVEIRTVVLEQNYTDLPLLADFVSKHLSVAEVWALMQLENIGFAKMNWSHIFVDTSKKFSAISTALSIASLANINVHLYNFPKCTIPQEWREFACKSISDWKNKYLESCNDCTEKKDCCGFFDWYNEKIGFNGIQAL